MAFVPLVAVRNQATTRLSKCSFSGSVVRFRPAPLVPRPQPVRWSANISSNDFRPGVTIEVDGVVYRVNEFLHVKPGKGAAFVRTKLKNMKTGSSIERTFRAGETVKSASLEKVSMQHTYVDGGLYVFMNMETYDEERMSAETLGANIVKFLLEGMEVQVLRHNNDILGVDLPKVLSFTVTRTDPGVKGNTAQGNALKPCTIESGAEVMVPLFISEGKSLYNFTFRTQI